MLTVDDNILVSVTEINLDIEIFKKNNPQADPKTIEEIKNNLDKTSSFEFKYKSNGNIIAGIFAIAKEYTQAKIPVVICNRGGNRDYGAWEKFSPLCGYVACLVRSGYAVFMSQYSGGPGSTGEDDFGGNNVEDVLVLGEIIRNNIFLDENKIGMIGWSRGGMMTYRALASVDWIKAAVSVAGTASTRRQFENRIPSYKTNLRELFDIDNSAELELRSALCWPEKFCDTTPLLMIHGTADWRVSPLDSLELGLALYKHKKPYRLSILEGGDHGLTEYREIVNNQIVSWFDHYLKNEGALPNLEPHGK